jgi:hypothetical protein
MAKGLTNAPVSSPWDSEVRLLAWLATCVSVFSFLFYFQRGQVLLYGDAVAHMNIARRVFDSKTPGLLQLGTVWLPLPHLLMIPFLIPTEMWRRGSGGSIPSLIAYVLGVVGMFRLVRGTFAPAAGLGRANPGNASPWSVEPDLPARVAAWTAAVVYAANPNLIYMQTTAMGEALYLALFIWAVVYFSEASRGNAKALTKCGLCLAAACLTRYDGWFLAVVMAAAVLAAGFFDKSTDTGAARFRLPRAAVAKFVLIAAAAPVLWLVYNGIVYRNPLEFENGPYSAKAIERKTQTSGNPGHPGSGNLLLASQYFLKSAEANVAENQWLQKAWILLGLAALAAVAFIRRRPGRPEASPALWPLLFLLLPVPFYALSVAYGGVPIFVPAWWPFTHYNVRYGLQLLPAFAVTLALVVYFVLRIKEGSRRLRLACVFCVIALVVASYASIWLATPICQQEAQINMRGRNLLEAQLAGWLQKLPPNSTLLMYLGDHVGAVQQAGIPLKRVINEGNHRVWMQPADSEGLWERALANPAEYADYVVAFEGDDVWKAVQARHLKELVAIHTTGQARAVLYRAR